MLGYFLATLSSAMSCLLFPGVYLVTPMRFCLWPSTGLSFLRPPLMILARTTTKPFLAL